MGVPASPFLGFLVGVGPADEVEGAFSILAKSSTFFRFCKAFEGGLGRACEGRQPRSLSERVKDRASGRGRGVWGK